MSTLHVKYLLIGGGMASSAAAEAIRRRDSQGSILLVGQEVNRPYHRPSLSQEYLRREKNRAELTTSPLGWFVEKNIELRTGRRLSCIDTARSTATLDNGEEVSYDAALLAVGASPKPLRIPGADLPNVFYLRSIEDADRLQHAIDQAMRQGHRHPRGVGRGTVAVIGGGLLGVDLACSLTHVGLYVNLIVGQVHPWFRTVGEASGAFLMRHLTKHGVAVHIGNRAQSITGDGRVQHVVLASGETIDCDFAIGAVGINPNREILRNTPIAAETAVLVDEHCRSSVPNIYAAGDCAAILDPLFGKHRIIDHWDNAQITGAIAGANMAGADETYKVVNHFSSDLFDLPVNVWGERRLVHHRLLRGATNGENSFIEFGIAADGRVAQVVKVGSDGDDANLLMSFVSQRIQTQGKEELIKDPTRALTDVIDWSKRISP